MTNLLEHNDEPPRKQRKLPTQKRASSSKRKPKYKVVLPIDPEFNEDWKAQFRQYLGPYDKDNVCKFLFPEMNERKRQKMMQFCKTLHTLHQYIVDPKGFEQHRNELFEWKYVLEIVQDEDTFAPVDEELTKIINQHAEKPFSEGRMVLSLLSIDNNTKTMKPWVYIADSGLEHEQKGLFAAREFELHCPIGFYIGNVMFRYDQQYTCTASGEYEEYYKERGYNHPKESRCIDIIDKTGYRCIVDPSHNSDFEPVNLGYLMGMHYLNDITLTFNQKKDRKGFQSAKRRINSKFRPDGTLVATKRIHKGEEIFVRYHQD